MTNLPASRPPILGAVARWWHNWRNSKLREVEALSGEDLDQIAKDIGVSVFELKTLMRHPEDDARLLHRRMAALHIDPGKISWLGGAVLKDMERACSLCESRTACLRDLARNPDGIANGAWHDYCPNAATLEAMAAVNASSAEAGKTPGDGCSAPSR